MKNRSKVLLMFFFIGLSFVSMQSVATAACMLTNAGWNAGSVAVGQTIQLQITGNDCAQGTPVEFKVVEVDTISNDVLFSRTVPGFSGGGNSMTFPLTFTPSMYDEGGNESTGTVYYTATANGVTVTSPEITFTGVAPSPSMTSSPLPSTTSPGGGGGGGQNVGFNFDYENPLGGGEDNLLELINTVGKWIFNLAIPIAVIFIVYGGVLFLTAGANPKNVDKGKEILKNAVIGLAIVFIGRGFVSLIYSIIELGN